MITLGIIALTAANLLLPVYYLVRLRRLHRLEREMLALIELWMALQQAEIDSMPAYRVGEGWQLGGDGRTETKRDYMLEIWRN